MRKLNCIFIYLTLLLGIGNVVADTPNILWLTFEDTSANRLGVYGNKDITTPNIDALA